MLQRAKRSFKALRAERLQYLLRFLRRGYQGVPFQIRLNAT